jgi:hypothetical protein
MRFLYFYLMSHARARVQAVAPEHAVSGVNSGYLTIWVDPSGTDQEG